MLSKKKIERANVKHLIALISNSIFDDWFSDLESDQKQSFQEDICAPSLDHIHSFHHHCHRKQSEWKKRRVRVSTTKFRAEMNDLIAVVIAAVAMSFQEG